MTASEALRSPSLAPAAVGVGVLLVGFATDTALCPFRICTGQACAGCGMTRALLNGVRGNFAESWRYHPLAIVIVVQLVVWMALRRFAPQVLNERIVHAGLIANAVVFLAVWALRWRLGLLDHVL